MLQRVRPFDPVLWSSISFFVTSVSSCSKNLCSRPFVKLVWMERVASPQQEPAKRDFKQRDRRDLKEGIPALARPWIVQKMWPFDPLLGSKITSFVTSVSSCSKNLSSRPFVKLVSMDRVDSPQQEPGKRDFKQRDRRDLKEGFRLCQDLGCFRGCRRFDPILGSSITFFVTSVSSCSKNLSSRPFVELSLWSAQL